MSAVPPDASRPNDATAPAAKSGASESGPDLAALLLQLRRKQGNWVAWGQACQALHKAGIPQQEIFEKTGFEPPQQNQVVVAAQVYQGLVAAGASEAVRSHFEHRGSDLLYELRILSQADRLKAAELALTHSLDSEAIQPVAKALREYSYREKPPEGFTDHPGDAVAYDYWRLARQQSDLQMRSRLIAQGLRFAHSPSARKQIESLLSDFTIAPTKAAPRLPFYRLESESELPRLLPVAGSLPLSVADISAVPLTLGEPPFGIVRFDGKSSGAWVAVPGWLVILQAEDPVALMTNADQLPHSPDSPSETVLVVVDRAQRQWQDDSYFLSTPTDDPTAPISLNWFPSEPQAKLLGRVILILRPKKILDESYTSELWQLDE